MGRSDESDDHDRDGANRHWESGNFQLSAFSWQMVYDSWTQFEYELSATVRAGCTQSERASVLPSDRHGIAEGIE